jgi:5-keto 4-deoxyuronate isomerase
MFQKTYQATHPSMIDGIDNETLRELYLVSRLFEPDSVRLNYSHNERMVIGGAAPVAKPVRLPDQEAPLKGAPFLERRELGAVNVGGGAGTISIDGEADHRASPPKSILCSHTWILSQISWLQAICWNPGPPSLLHSSKVHHCLTT